VISILYNKDANALRRDMPSDAGAIVYATLRVCNDGGSEIEAADEADIWGCVANVAVVTLSNATDAGDYQVTLALSTETRDLYPGDVIRVGDATGAREDIRVRAWDSATSIATLEDYLRADHAAGETVVGRWAAYTLDTTTVADYPVNQRLVLEWEFADATVSGNVWLASDEAQIVKYAPGSAGLDDRFRARYRRYYDTIEQGDWNRWETDARQEIVDIFAARGKDVARIVDAVRLDEAIMAEIALLISYAQGTDWEAECVTALTRRNEVVERLASLPLWSDTDGDHIREDEETQTAQRPYPRRRLF
jgi:hypothetical protein